MALNVPQISYLKVSFEVILYGYQQRSSFPQINKHASSGGGDAVEEHRGQDGDGEADASCLAFLDGAEEVIRQRSSSGSTSRESEGLNSLRYVCLYNTYLCIVCRGF